MKTYKFPHLTKKKKLYFDPNSISEQILGFAPVCDFYILTDLKLNLHLIGNLPYQFLSFFSASPKKFSK